MEKYEVINYIRYAIPVFILLIGVEVFVAWRTKQSLYRVNDTVSDISAGLMSRVVGFFAQVVLFGMYVWVYENFRLELLLAKTESTKSVAGYFALSDFTGSAWVVVTTFIICFFLQDHQYYWFHRLSHQVNFIWGSHVAHHSSEEYNLSVALRQGGIQGFFSTPFYLPLALIGFHPVMYLTVAQFVTLYQFWIHTRAIDKLPAWFEWFFNTPSNHRVHHGRNPQYIDRNHAGTFMIWDRMYGSFEPEGEDVVYGITNPLNTWNPLWAQVHYWVEVFKLAWAAPKWRDKILVWFKSPGWMPEGMGPHKTAPKVDARTYKKFGLKIPVGLNVYAVLNFITCIVALLQLPRSSSLLNQGMLATYIVLTMLMMGLIFDLRSYAFPWELLRLLLIATVGVTAGMEFGNNLVVAISVVLPLGLAAWFWTYRAEFQAPPEKRVLQSTLNPGT